MAARFVMAVVVVGSPLTVTIEGTSAVVAAEDFVGGLTTDDRVQAAFLGDRLTVLAKAGGAGGSGTTEATTATANTLALRDGSARIKAANGVAADDVATVGQIPVGDTGWVGMTFPYAYESYPGSPGEVRKLNGVIFVRGLIRPTAGSFAASSSALIAVLPTWARPPITLFLAFGTNTGASAVTGSFIAGSGNVQVRMGPDASPFVGVAGHSWPAA